MTDRADAAAWIRTHVEVAGEIVVAHERPWSTVLRVPTTGGDVFFKANAPGSANEAALLEALVPLAPDVLPVLLASDVERNWVLLADAGDRAREHPETVRWDALLARYADLQAAAAPAALALGLPDRRLASLPDLYTDVGGDDRPLVDELCAELAEHAIPETVQHDDLHDGNVFVRGGRQRILDWGDAIVSHPFMTIAITRWFAGEHAVDAYLARWRELGYDGVDRALSLAQRLAGISRAVTHTVFPDPRDAKQEAIRIWLARVKTPPELWTDD